MWKKVLKLTEANKHLKKDKWLPKPHVLLPWLLSLWFCVQCHLLVLWNFIHIFLLWTINTWLFKDKPSKEANKLQVSYFPWTKADVWTIVKEFHEVTKEPHWFPEQFDIVIQTCQKLVSFSDLYQLVHMLFSEGQAQHWIKFDGNIFKRLKKKQIPNFWQNARTLVGDLHWAITVAFLKPVDWNKI